MMITMQHNDSIVAKPENALNQRIRHMVRLLIIKDHTVLRKAAILRFEETSWKNWVKLVIGLICLGIFLYQACERLAHYLSVPTLVDVTFEQQMDTTFPAVTICLTDFGQLTNLLLGSTQIANLSSCEEETNVTGQQVMNMSNIHYWIGRTDINVTWINAHTEPKLPVKLQKAFVRPYGVCTTFQSEATGVVPFIRTLALFENRRNVNPIGVLKLLMTMVCPHPIGQEPHHKDFITFSITKGMDFGMRITKYKFLNLHKKPCSDVHTNWDCINECVTRILPNRLSCRHHYLSPKMTKLPLCTNHSAFKKALTDSFEIIGGLDPDNTCNCIPPCERHLYKINYRPRPKSEKILRISLFLEDNYIKYFKEHYSYEIVALLCDIGGIIGLYLGLSVLSICDLLKTLYYYINRSCMQQNCSLTSDPIYLKVSKHYKALKECRTKKLHENILSNPSPTMCLTKSIQYLLLLLCLFSCVYISFDKMTIYLNVPTATIVEIKSQADVEFPMFTYCKDTNSIIKYKQQIAEAQNLSSLCEVDFLDILQISGINISKLWELSFTAANITENDVHPARRLQILGESCVELNIGKLDYFGRNLFERIKVMPVCDAAIKLYVTPPGDEFDFSNFHVISNEGLFSSLEFSIQEYHISPLLSNCVAVNEARQCKEKCINRRMMEELQCRLPLMDDIFNVLPLCNSSKAAKESRAAYVSIRTTTDPTKDCKCQRQCQKNILESNRIFIPGKNSEYPFVYLHFGYLDSDRQVFIEIPSYTAYKLICDIGGILGLLLGFSFLTFMDTVIFMIVIDRKT